jgi:hypothetical protein
MIRTRNTYTVAGCYTAAPPTPPCICCAGKGYPGHRYGVDLIGEDGQPVAELGQPLEMIAYRSPEGTRITVTIETEEAP